MAETIRNLLERSVGRDQRRDLEKHNHPQLVIGYAASGQLLESLKCQRPGARSELTRR